MNELLCLVNDTNNNSTYYDNIIVYFNELSSEFPSFIFFKEILIINLSYPIISFFEMVCELLIIYYLHPIYILIRDNIYYFFMRIIFIINKSNYHFYLENPTFYITQAADLFAILGYCVFLQLIELKFCRFDYDLNKNIIERGKKEANINFEEDVSEASGNSEEEEQQQRKLSDDSLYS